MKKKRPTFEPSDSLKRFIPPLFEIGKTSPPTSWGRSRRSFLNSGEDRVPVKRERRAADRGGKKVALAH